MGACQFTDTVHCHNNSAKDAFRVAVDAARYDHGHSGYTGTIAEKDRFEIAGSAPTVSSAYRRADKLMDEDKFCDKWGPAGCITVPGQIFVFFGVASE